MKFNFNKITKGFAVILSTIALSFSSPQTVNANNNDNYKYSDTKDDVEMKSRFIKSLQAQLKNGVVALKKNSERYIKGIYINDETVRIDLISGESLSGTVKRMRIRDISIPILYLEKNSIDIKIRNINVLEEFKGEDVGEFYNSNIRIEQCRSLWLNNCFLYIPDYKIISNLENLKSLIITNSTLKDFYNDNIYLIFNNPTLENFILCGGGFDNIIGVTFEHPENLKYVALGDGTGITSLNLGGASNLKAWYSGTDVREKTIDNMGIEEFINYTFEPGGHASGNNFIVSIYDLIDAISLDGFDLNSIPACDPEHVAYVLSKAGLDSTKISMSPNGGDTVSNDIIALFKSKNLPLSNPTIREANELFNTIVNQVYENVTDDSSDYDKIKEIFKAYLKSHNTLILDRALGIKYNTFTYNDCQNLIRLINSFGIRAYLLEDNYYGNYENNDDRTVNILIYTDKKILVINVSDFNKEVISKIDEIMYNVNTMEEIKNTVGENFESLVSDICQEIPYDDISDVGLENELRFKELYLPSSVLNDIANYLSFTKNPTQLKFTIPQTGRLERYSHQADFKKRLRTYYTWNGGEIYQAYNNQSFNLNWRPSAPTERE